METAEEKEKGECDCNSVCVRQDCPDSSTSALHTTASQLNVFGWYLSVFHLPLHHFHVYMSVCLISLLFFTTL